MIVMSKRELLLLFVAYHPSFQEVQQLATCLKKLPDQVGYAVVVNDYSPGEPVDYLASDADVFLCNPDNPGYGRAVNRLVAQIDSLPKYIAVLNTDLYWKEKTFETLLSWLQEHPDVTLAVPKILNPAGEVQHLCKRNPTVVGLFSRRFVPGSFKPPFLKRYDRYYAMLDHDYDSVFQVPYLSGCCMVIKTEPFLEIGGFDERYFLYLEDADLTRSLSKYGRCVHYPDVQVTHGWGRGNYLKFRLMVVNLVSALRYFCKWGWKLL